MGAAPAAAPGPAGGGGGGGRSPVPWPLQGAGAGEGRGHLGTPEGRAGLGAQPRLPARPEGSEAPPPCARAGNYPRG